MHGAGRSAATNITGISLLIGSRTAQLYAQLDGVEVRKTVICENLAYEHSRINGQQDGVPFRHTDGHFALTRSIPDAPITE